MAASRREEMCDFSISTKVDSSTIDVLGPSSRLEVRAAIRNAQRTSAKIGGSQKPLRQREMTQPEDMKIAVNIAIFYACTISKQASTNPFQEGSRVHRHSQNSHLSFILKRRQMFSAHSFHGPQVPANVDTRSHNPNTPAAPC